MKLFAWMPRPFASRIEFLEYLVFITMCVAGVLNASWLWPLVGAMTLLLLSWSRYRHLLTRAARIDADYRDLAWLERAFKVGNGLAHYPKARTLRARCEDRPRRTLPRRRLHLRPPDSVGVDRVSSGSLVWYNQHDD